MRAVKHLNNYRSRAAVFTAVLFTAASISSVKHRRRAKFHRHTAAPIDSFRPHLRLHPTSNLSNLLPSLLAVTP